MALFSRKKKTAAAEAPKAVGSVVSSTQYDVTTVIVGPRITEKATQTAEKNVYVFNVTKDATKPAIAKAIQALYKVTPKKIAIAHTPAKKVFVRGKFGTKSGVRKAYVYLKDGDKIEIA